jgi:hypothetical protein
MPEKGVRLIDELHLILTKKGVHSNDGLLFYFAHPFLQR